MSRTLTEDRFTKIVCTIGRQHGDSLPEMLETFYNHGMDVARINMSHCAPDYGPQIEALDWVNNLGLPAHGPRIATLGDLQGPKVRLGSVAEENYVLPTGQEILLRAAEGSTDKGILPIAPVLAEATFRSISQAIHGTGGKVQLTLGDGDAVLEVGDVRNLQEAVATVRVGGAVRSRMGFTAKGVELDVEVFTEKDKKDLAVLLEHNVTYVGVSFVRHAEDLRRIRRYISDVLGVERHVPLIAKIERPSAVKHAKDILRVSEGIMVARGDLGLSIDMEDVPQVQKQLVNLCRTAAKPVIIATQMLESMTFNPEPTRAEVTDVFNAIMDGCDAVMLSGETSRGDHPTAAIDAMKRIATRAELWRSSHVSERTKEQLMMDLYESYSEDMESQTRQIDDEIARAACHLAEGVSAQIIATLTASGATAKRVARQRSHVPVIAAGVDEQVMRELLLTYGVRPLILKDNPSDSFPERSTALTDQLEEMDLVDKGDIVVMTGGEPDWGIAGTNQLRVRIIQ